MAGRFYPRDPDALRALVEGQLAEVHAAASPATAAIVPHAGLQYSGQCAAQVFKRIDLAPTIVILAPNHTGALTAVGGASAWTSGAFQTPLGDVPVAEEFLLRLCEACDLVSHDSLAHEHEHAIEVELPFVTLLSPQSVIAPIVLAWDDWERCSTLARALAALVNEWPEPVSLLASSDMTHYESADVAAAKDRLALDNVQRLDGEGLLATCHRERITMCGRAPAATVLEAARLLGRDEAEVVDYRHSGWVTRDDTQVVAYAGVVIR